MLRTAIEWIARFWGSLRRRRSDRDLEHELYSHLELTRDADLARGLTPADAGHSAGLPRGGVSQAMDALRDQRGLPWFDALRSDVVFGWRHLKRTPRTTVAAVLSLALAGGATMGAFRLVDAVLWRSLPVSNPTGLFAVTMRSLDRDNRWQTARLFTYPTYREYTRALTDRADVLLLGMAAPVAIRVRPDAGTETVNQQFVSGNVFASFGMSPALGRLITSADDQAGATRLVVVLSHQFWVRRFGGSPDVLGSTLQYGNQRLEIVGVAPRGFSGTEPGSLTDIFIPATLNREALDNPGWVWFQMWIRPRGTTSADEARQRLQALLSQQRQEEAKSFPASMPKERVDAFLREQIQLVSAASGVSDIQNAFRQPLLLLNALAALVLLMACVNVAGTLSGQSLERQQEMALRVSIGATRGRLIRLLLVECALLALMASTIAVLFASWTAPLVVAMFGSADRAVQLDLTFDWRAFAFSLALTAIVTLLFGMFPAMAASAARPVGALKAEHPRTRRRIGSFLVGGQMAFSFVVLFVAGLFVVTFARLSARSLGFSADRVVTIQVASRTEQPPAIWNELVRGIADTTGVESASLAAWAPLTGNAWTRAVHTNGERTADPDTYFLDVTAGYFTTLGIAMREGRDFQPGDRAPGRDDRKQPIAGAGIVNDAFARRYFAGASPVGRRVAVGTGDAGIPLEIVGLVADAAYLTVRESLRPTVYIPIESRDGGTLLLKTAGDPATVTSALQRRVVELRPDVRVRRVQPLNLLVTRQLVRERVLAALSLFFAGVALVLAGIGLYGIVNGAVLRERRDIGIRMALGARRLHLVQRVVGRISAAATAGCLAGLFAGIAAARFVQNLLFGVTSTDLLMMLLPAAALAIASALAAVPPVVRAMRTNLVSALRE